MQLYPQRPVWTEQGIDYHKQQQRLFKDRTLKRFGLTQAEMFFNVSVQSESLNIHGIVDCYLKTDNKIYPVEFKLYGVKPTKAQIYQTVAYGLVLSRQLSKNFNTAFVLFEQKGKTHKIEVNKKLKQKVTKKINEITFMLSTAQMPDSPASQGQCSQCEFLNYCNDRF
jgi:CRISPR-associated exonuclease Cas4